MKNIGFLLLALFVAQAARAQRDVEKRIADTRRELRAVGVDTSVCYYTYSYGVKKFVPGDTACKARNIRYLFWTQGPQSLIQRFDECNRYPSERISTIFMNAVKAGIGRLPQEKILPAEYVYVKNGEKVKIGISETHNPQTVFEIYTGDTVIRKYIDWFDIGVVYVEGKYPNINYLNNLNTVQNNLKELAEAIVERKYGIQPL